MFQDYPARVEPGDSRAALVLAAVADVNYFCALATIRTVQAPFSLGGNKTDCQALHLLGA